MKLFKTPQFKYLACQECGIESSTVTSYTRIGEKKVWGIPMEVTSRLLCSKCGAKFDLETKGFKICNYCRENKPIVGKCPNCGAP